MAAPYARYLALKALLETALAARGRRVNGAAPEDALVDILVQERRDHVLERLVVDQVDQPRQLHPFVRFAMVASVSPLAPDRQYLMACSCARFAMWASGSAFVPYARYLALEARRDHVLERLVVHQLREQLLVLLQAAHEDALGGRRVRGDRGHTLALRGPRRPPAPFW